ncbi:MAG: hypothetical protein J5761_03675 [Paludibacteraceae bacterium]|nr:hypothetical protein [Paludibacteraceae bacterium]
MPWLLSISLSLLSDLFLVGGSPTIIEQDSVYEKVALTDSATLEVYKGDSIFVVLTVCAPQCSSCARVYNKEWQLIETPTPPFQSIFPLATVNKDTGKITWVDNNTWEY